MLKTTDSAVVLGSSSVLKIAMLAITIFVSAFLLFQVQPLVSKQLLPWFGGSPAVWTTAMLFFQTILFGGYAYAHIVTRYVPLRVHLTFHVGLIIASALMAFLIAPSETLKPTGSENPTTQVLLLLIVSVGLPYFTLASTGPIVQAWFAKLFPGASPYRLYSLSNVGSYLALISFPYVFEPYLSLPGMRAAWIALYWVFATACVSTAIGLMRWMPSNRSLRMSSLNDGKVPAMDSSTSAKPSWLSRLLWISLPALASLTMISVTDHVSHNVAPEPRLWITSLGLYLLTFIITFDHERWYRPWLVASLCLLGVFLLTARSELLDLTGIEWSWGATELRWSHFGLMFLICFLCHGELVRLRPKSTQYLTEFYMCISAGGACGGLFASLVAVNFFSDYFEWPICLVLAATLSASVLAVPSISQVWRRGIICATTIVSIGWILFFLDPFEWRTRETKEYKTTRLLVDRNFYGVVSVEDRIHKSDPKRSYRGFYSGNVSHGTQLKDPENALLPVNYYGENSLMGETIRYLQGKKESIRIAVIGLGAGSIASYARPSDSIDFYEINPDVIRIAESHFTFLKECKGKVDVLLGDGRLKLEANNQATYDVIVLDAFTGGSVPIHLLTKEAFAIYKQRLFPDGIVLAHITNSYLNLYPVVKLQAKELKMETRCKFLPFDSDTFTRRNFYMALTVNSDYLAKFQNVFPPQEDKDGKERLGVEPDQADVGLWTDHFSSIQKIVRE